MSKLAALRRKNRKYLRDLVARELKPIPAQYALEVAIRVFSDMIYATAVDSGQAAANWQFIPYTGEPKTEEQKILWGYDDRDPSAPGVGWKRWYREPGQPGGDITVIHGSLMHAAVRAKESAPLTIKGVLVYNPITPGFADFAPGNDAKYEQRALELAYVEAPMALSSAQAKAEAALRLKFRAVR